VYIAGTGTVVNGTVCGNINLGIQPSAKGGGIYLSGGLVVGTLVTNNAQHTQRMKICGVGAYVTDGGALSNCIIIDNHDVPDVGSCGFGGGVYIDNGSLVDCVISSNSSSASQFAAGGVTYGGGVYMTGTALVDRCIFRKNYQVRTDGAAFGYGGGVCCSNGVMRNCLIMGNTSINDAGGLYLFGGTNENCTIVRNSAVSNYGGVYWTNSPSIVNDIVYNNIGGVENDVLPVYLGLTNVTYSCAPLLTVGTGNLTNDPIFIASGSGSGTTFVEGDYRLPRGSPCLDKGLDAGWMKPGWDLVRNSRSKGLGVDMGAYEYQVELGTIIRIR